jgi:tRNA threonylcarbamoyladenosine biosynthesis protein TsaB
MSLILNIETATPVCSVALGRDGTLLVHKTSSEHNIHSEKLTVFIENIMLECGFDFNMLDAIAVSEGPGSYTGLRIGASVAKGLCYGLDKPLISIKTLQAMAYGMSIHCPDENALYCPMIDARRMEVYTALYDFKGNEIETTTAKVIDAMSFQDVLAKQKVLFAGDGMEKCKEVIKSPNSLFLEQFCHSSEWMIPLAEAKWKSKQFADTAYFEPFYLKEFQAWTASSSA